MLVTQFTLWECGKQDTDLDLASLQLKQTVTYLYQTTAYSWAQVLRARITCGSFRKLKTFTASQIRFLFLWIRQQWGVRVICCKVPSSVSHDAWFFVSRLCGALQWCVQKVYWFSPLIQSDVRVFTDLCSHSNSYEPFSVLVHCLVNNFWSCSCENCQLCISR